METHRALLVPKRSCSSQHDGLGRLVFVLQGLIKKPEGHTIGRELAHKLSDILPRKFSFEPRFKPKSRLVLISPELSLNGYLLVFTGAYLAGSYW